MAATPLQEILNGLPKLSAELPEILLRPGRSDDRHLFHCLTAGHVKTGECFHLWFERRGIVGFVQGYRAASKELQELIQDMARRALKKARLITTRITHTARDLRWLECRRFPFAY